MRFATLRSSVTRAVAHFSTALIVGVLSMQTSYAGPEGGVVVRGEGHIIRPNATTTNINQQTQNIAIDWQSFNVNQNETVNFHQPNSTATALNRIFDQSASQIFGTINANGRVILVNANGMYFGQTAAVNVGALVASGMDINPDSFMSGDWVFENADGATGGLIVNHGLLQAIDGGSISLFGGGVENTGTIIANYGSINLAAGRQATVDFDGDGLIQFAVDGELLENAYGLDSAVSNSGDLQAMSGRVLLAAHSANDVFAQVVNNEGIIQANGVTTDGGRVFLTGTGGDVINTGNITATSEAGKGGEVRILGDRVGLFGNSLVDVSGATGGGTALIGGDYQGSNGVQTASQTLIAPDVVIRADALMGGNGGRVIVWADETTQFYGAISARGGSASGDGGFAEVSGKGNLVFRGTADLLASNGEAGTLLLDPEFIVIQGGSVAGDDDGELPTIAFDDPGAPAGVTFTISEAALESAGANVILQATNGISVTGTFGNAGGNTGDGAGIVALANNLSLTMETRNASGEGSTGIDLLNGTTHADGVTFRTNGTGTITLTAGTNGGDAGSAGISVGSLITANRSDTSSAGITISSEGDVVIGGQIRTGNVTAGTNDRTSGNISITSSEGSVSTLAGATLTTGTVTVSGNNDSATSGNISINAAGNVSLGAAVTTGDATVNDDGASSGDVSVTSSAGAISVASTVTTGSVNGDDQPSTVGDINLSAAGTVGVAGSLATGTITSGGGTATGGDIAVLAADSFTNGSGSAAAITVGAASGSGTVTQGQFSATTDGAAGDILVTSASDLRVGVLDTLDADTANVQVTVTGGALTVGAASNLDQDNVLFRASEMNIANTVTTSGEVTLTTGAGRTIDLGSVATTADTTLELSDTELNNIVGASVLRIGDAAVGDIAVSVGVNSTSTSTLHLLTGGNITQADSLEVANLAVSAGGSVTLDDSGNDVDNIAGTVSGANSFTFRDADGFVLTTVDGLVGIDAGAGSITLTADTSAMSDADDANDYLVTTGTVTLAAAAAIGSALNSLSTDAGSIVVTGTGGNNVFITDSGAGGDTSFDITTGGAGGITLVQSTNDLAIAGISTTGLLDVTAAIGAGTITQTGAMTVGGTAAFSTLNDDQSITLNGANDITGAVTFATTSGGGNTGNVSFTNTHTGGTNLGASSVAGSMAIVSDDAISQSGVLTVATTSSFTTNNADQAIALNTQLNALSGAASFTTNGAAGDVSLDNGTTNLLLGTSSVGGDLAVTVDGTIGQTGSIAVAGTSNFVTSGNDQAITLLDSANALAGVVTFTTNSVGPNSGHVALDNGTTALDLGASTIDGNLSVVNGNTISNSGALTVSGNASFTTDVDDQAIDLDNVANAIAGTVAFVTQGTAGNVIFDNGTSNIDFAASTVRGSLTATSGETIGQSGLLDVSGTASFVTNVDDKTITLGNTSNVFGGAVSFTTQGTTADVTVDGGAANLQFGASTIAGNLSATSASITQSGALDVTGTADFVADVANGDITLLTAGNDIDGSVTFTTSGTTGDVAFDNDDADNTGTNIGASTVSGLFSVDAANALAITGTINTSGTATGDVSLTGGTGVALADNAIVAGANDVAVTATTGGITDANPTGSDGTAEANITTTGAVSLTANGAGGIIGGAAADADIDLSGTPNLSIDSTTSVYVSNDQQLSDFALTLTPAGNTYSLTGATTISISDDGFHATVNSVQNSDADLNFSLTTTSGNILIANNGIGDSTGGGSGIGAGNVTLTAEGGGIYEATTVSTVTDITTSGTVFLDAAFDIGGVGFNQLDIQADPTAGGTVTVDLTVTTDNIGINFNSDAVIAGVNTSAGSANDVFIDATGTSAVTYSGANGYSGTGTDDFQVTLGSGTLTFETTTLDVGSLAVVAATGNVVVDTTITSQGDIDIDTGGASATITGTGALITADVAGTAGDIILEAGSIGTAGSDLNVQLGTGTDAGELYLTTNGSAGNGEAHINGSGQYLEVGDLDALGGANLFSIVNDGASIDFVGAISHPDLLLSASTTTSGDILFNNTLTAGSVTADSAGNIAVNNAVATANVGTGNSGSIDLTAAGNIGGTGSLSTGTTAGAPGEVTGSITLDAVNIGTGGDALDVLIPFQAANTTGLLNIATNGGDAYLTTTGTALIGNLSATAASTVSVVSTAAHVSLDAAGTNTGTGNIDLVLNAADALAFGRDITLASLDADAVGDILVGGAVSTADNASAATGSIDLLSTTGGMLGSGSFTTGNATGFDSGDIVVSVNGAIPDTVSFATGGASGATVGDISLTAGTMGSSPLGTVDVSFGSGTNAGELALTSTGGNVFVTSTTDLVVGALTATGGETFSIATSGGSAMTLASATDSNIGGINLQLTTAGGAGGTVTFDRAMTVGALTVNATDAIAVNAALATSASTTGSSGNINFTSTGGGLTGTGGSLTTGAADNSGNAGAGAVTSGSINVSVNGAIGSGVAFATGAATDSALADDTVTAGDINLAAHSIGSVGNRVAVTAGAATAGGSNDAGELNIDTSGSAGAADSYISSTSNLEIGTINTVTGQVDTTDILVTGGNVLTLTAALDKDNVPTSGLAGDILIFNAQDGTFNGNAQFIDLGLQIASAGAQLSVTSDALIAGSFTNVQQAAGGITLAPFTGGTTIGLGTGAGTFQLNDGDLDALVNASGGATGVLTIGNATAGAVTIDDVTFGASQTLEIITGDTINDDDDVGFAFSGGNLILSATGNIGNLGGAQGLNVDLNNLRFNSDGTVTVTEAGGLTAAGLSITGANTADNLTLTSSGAIGNAVGASLTVADGSNTGNANLSGSAINLGVANAGTFDFDTLTFNSTGAVSIAENSAAILSGASTAGSLVLTAAGSVTDATTTSLTVTNNASFTANDGAAQDITLGDDISDTLSVGGLTFDGNNVDIETDGDIVLQGNSVAEGDLDLNANSASDDAGITNDAGSNLSVTGNAHFLAESGDVSLGYGIDGDFNFGSLTFTTINGGGVVVREDSDMVLSGTSSSAGIMVLITSAGGISDDATADLSVSTDFAAITEDGSDIILDDNTHDFGSLAFSAVGGLVEIHEASNTTLNGSFLSGSGYSFQAGALDLVSAGAIADDGAAAVVDDSLTVTGNASFDANSGASAITLGNSAGAATHTFGTLTFTGNNVSIIENDAMQLAGNSAASTLNLTADGSITDAGDVTVTGTTTLVAGAANDIQLDSGTNDFGTVVITSGNNVTLRDANSINLGAATVAGTYDVTANAIDVTGAVSAAALDFDVSGAANDIIDSTGTLSVTGASLFTVAGGSVLLDGLNNFAGAVSVTGGADTVTLNDTNAIVLGDITATTLNVTASGTITDDATGDLAISGTTTLAAGAGNDITLDIATNNFGTVAITSGNNVTLRDANSINLGAATVAGTYDVTANTIDVTGAVSAAALDFDVSGAAGNITDSTGSLSVTGTSAFTVAASDDVILDGGNNFSGAVSVTGGADTVTLNDTNAIVLGDITATTLNVTASGTITDDATGDLDVSGTTTLAAGAGNDITLDIATNNFGTVAITSGNNVTLRDADSINLSAATVAGTYDVTANAIDVTGAVSAAALDFDVSGAAGNITDSTGTLSVTGTSAFTVAVSDDVILDGGNNFSGAVSVTGGADTVTLNDTNAIVLGDITATTLNVTASGTITDDATGDLDVSGTTTLAAGAGNDITLDIATNNFGTVAITSGNNVTLRDADSINLGAATVAGTYDVTANAIDVTGAVSAAALDFDVSGAAGNITDSTGTLAVTGTSTFTAQAGDNITLDSTSNNFGTVVAVSGNNLVLEDSNGIVLGSLALSGGIDINAGGNITTSGNIASGAAAAIVLNTTGSLTLSNTLAAGSGGVDLDAGTTMVINQAITASGGGVVDLQSVGAMSFGANGNITTTGDISVTSTGSAITMTDGAVFDNRNGGAGTGTIALNADTNVALGRVLSDSTVDVTATTGVITDNTVGEGAGNENIVGTIVTLGSATGIGTFNAAGHASNAGDIDVNATELWATLSGNGNIGIHATDSIYVGAIDAGLTGGNSAVVDVLGNINDHDDDVLADIRADVAVLIATGDIGGIPQVAGGDLSLDVDVNSLTLNAGGAVDVLDVGFGTVLLNYTGDTDFAYSAVNRNIEIGEIDVRGLGTNDVTLTTLNGWIRDNNADAIDIYATGTISLLAGLGIGDAGGTLTMQAPTIQLSAGNATPTDPGSRDIIVESNATAATTFSSVTTTGTGIIDITQTGDQAMIVTTASTADGAISFHNTNGDLTVGTSVAAGGAGNNIALTTATSGNVILTGTTTAAGDQVTISSAGTISGAGLVSASTVDLGAATGIGSAGNAVNTTAADLTLATTTGLIEINETNGVNLNSVSADNFTLTAGGAVTDSGTIDVSGTTTLSASGFNISLDTASNDFGTVVVTAGNNVTLADTDGIVLGAATVAGTYDVTATTIDVAGAVSANAVDFEATAGNIADSTGTLTVATTSDFTVAGADVELNAANNFVGAVSVSGPANAVTLNDINALVLGGTAGITATTLNVTSNGTITDTGVLIVSGTTTLDSNGNNISLDNANDFGTVVVTSGNNVILADTDGISLGASNVAGTLSVTADGAITDSGNLVIGGAATLNAGATNNITLNNNNNFSSVGIVAANNVTLVDINAIDLAASTISGTLNVTSAGAINDTGALAVTGASTFAAGNTNDITLNELNNFSSVTINTANDVSLNDINALTLTSITATGAIGVTAGGALTAVNVVTTGGADTDDVTLQGASIEVDVITAAGSGDVSLTATGGSITDTNATASLITADDLAFSATAGVGSASAINTTVTRITSGQSTGAGNIVINETNGLTVTSLTNTNGAISVTSGGVLNTGTITASSGSGAVTLDSGASDLNINNAINAGGAVNIDTTGLTTIAGAGDITTSGDAVNFAGNVALAGAVAIDTTNGSATGGNVNFGGTVNGANSLTITAGTAGDVSFNAVGNATALNGLSVTADDISLGGNVSSTDLVALNGEVLLGGNTSITAGNTLATGVRFNGGVSGGASTLTVNAAADVNSDITAGRLIFNGNVDLSGGSDLTASNNGIAVTGNVVLSGSASSSSTIQGGGNSLVSLGGVTSNNGQSLTVRSEGDLTLTTVNVGSGSLVAQADSNNNDTGTAGANARTLTATSLQAGTVTLQGGSDGNEIFNIGSVTSTTGAVTINESVRLASSLTIASAGAVSLTDAISSTSGSSLTINNAGTLTVGGALALGGTLTQAGGAVVLNGDVSTTNDAVSFGGNVSFVSGTRSITSGTAAISLADVTGTGVLDLNSSGGLTLAGDIGVGTFDVAGMSGALRVANDSSIATNNTDLALNEFSDIRATGTGGSLTLDAGSADVVLPNVGLSGALDSLTVEGGDLSIRSVATSGDQTYTGSSIGIRGTQTASNGDIDLVGDVTLLADTTMDAANIDIRNVIDGAFDLELQAAAGDVTLRGAVGSTTALTSVSIDSQTAEVQDVTTSGAQSYDANLVVNGDMTGNSLRFLGAAQFPGDVMLTSDTIDFDGGTGSVTGSGQLTLIPETTGAAMDLGGTSGVLNLDVAALSGYAGTLVIGGVLDETNTNVFTMQRVAGDITISDELSIAGSLRLVAENSITLNSSNSNLQADEIILVAASSGGRILNPGRARLTANDTILVAGGQIGEDGEGISVAALSGGATLETATGAQTVFVDPFAGVTLNDISPARAIALQIAAGFNLNSSAQIQTSTQSSANREQSGGLADEGFIDASLFEDIALYEVSGSGIALPADQSEEEIFDEGPSQDCNSDDENCELQGHGAIGAVSPR